MEIFYHGGCLGFWLKKGKSSILEVIICSFIFVRFDVILILCFMIFPPGMVFVNKGVY